MSGSFLNIRLYVWWFAACGMLWLILHLGTRDRSFPPRLPANRPEGAVMWCDAEQVTMREGSSYFTCGGSEFEEGQTRFEGFARSGNSSARTDAKNPFAMACSVRVKGGETWRVSVWKKNLHGYGYAVADVGGEFRKEFLPDSSDENGWERVSLVFTVPDSVGETTAKCFAMAADTYGEPVYFDDLSVSKLDRSHAESDTLAIPVSGVSVRVHRQSDSQLHVLNFLQTQVKMTHPIEVLLKPGESFLTVPDHVQPVHSVSLSAADGTAWDETVIPYPVPYGISPLQQFMKETPEGYCPGCKETRDAFIIPAHSDMRFHSTVFIPPGKTLIVEEGARISLVQGAGIFCTSGVKMKGTLQHPIVLESPDSSGRGMLVMTGRVPSHMQHVQVRNLHAFSREGWILTGMVTFLESDVVVDHCAFENALAEDALNLVSCTFQLNACTFNHTASDALDTDFGQGKIEGCSFTNTRNDGADFSGTGALVSRCIFHHNGDKGISAGEGSVVIADSCSLSECVTGAASKDASLLMLDHTEIHDCGTGLACFRKKTAWGFPSVISIRTIWKDCRKDIHQEEGSHFFIRNAR